MIELPTLAETLTLSRADIEANFPGGGVYRRRSVLAAIANAKAQGEHAINGRIKYLEAQILPDTCDADLLVRRAAHRGVPRVSATAASGTITVTGLDDSEIPGGTTWQGPNGLIYALADGVVMDDTEVDVDVTCTTVGADTNIAEGATITLVNPVAGVEANAVVAAGGIAGGADIETIDRLRSRYLQHLRNPPRGGSETDYELWALAAHPDVDRVWVTRHMGPNTVTVLFSTIDGPIPSEPIVEAVDAYIQARKPVTTDVGVYAPIAEPIAFEIELTPDTPEVRAAVVAELQGLIAREGGTNTRLYLTHIAAAISGAAGESDHVLVAPAADVVTDYGHLHTYGGVTWG